MGRRFKGVRLAPAYVSEIIMCLGIKRIELYRAPVVLNRFPIGVAASEKVADFLMGLRGFGTLQKRPQSLEGLANVPRRGGTPRLLKSVGGVAGLASIA